MKNLLLFGLLLGLMSCNSEIKKSNFEGFGELLIGVPFDSIPSSGLFNKNNETQFVLNKLELTKEIGVVESVEVKTENGKIYEVKFTTGKFTNAANIKSYLSLVDETDFSKDHNKGEKAIEMRTYKTNDESITLETMVYTDPVFYGMNGYYSIKYTYYDSKIIEAIREKEQAEIDSIEKVEYFKDVKKL